MPGAHRARVRITTAHRPSSAETAYFVSPPIERVLVERVTAQRWSSPVRIALLLLVAFCLPVRSAPVSTEGAAYPSRPIRIVIGFTPGGQPDITSRLLAAKIAESVRQQIVIDNRPGGGGVIGTKIVADATPDGYTLLAVSSSHVIAPALRANLTYDVLKDFAGVTMTAAACYVLVVGPNFPVRSVQELIAMARAKPGQLAYSSAGMGSGTHFAAELFNQLAGIQSLHVPYKGIPEAMTDAMTGRVQYFLAPLASSSQVVKEGKLRGLAVTAQKRVAALPDVPTLAESSVPGFRWDSWAGVLAPVKTPRAIVRKLNGEFVQALHAADIQERFRALGSEPMPTSPEQFDQFIREQYAIVVKVAAKAGIKAQ
jgi:tripartite-type tricarboxylate transporter receptor subunit TctC